MILLMVPYIKGYDDGVELRYSLRSISQNARGLDIELTLIGDRPSWYTGDHIPSQADQQQPSRTRRVAAKVLEGCQRAGTTEFIHLDDDYLLMRPVESIEEFSPVAHRDELLKDQVREWRTSGGSWYKQLKETLQYLTDKGVDNAWSWELHKPIRVDPTQGSELIRDIWSRPDLLNVGWRTVYGSLATHPEEPKPDHDSIVMANRFPKGSVWASMTEAGWIRNGKRIASAFPRASKWEK